MNLHILFSDHHDVTPWWRTDEREDLAPDFKILTDCCCRRVRADHTVIQKRFQAMPVGGYGDYQDRFEFAPEEPVNWLSYASYYDPTWTVECGPGEGCKANPKLLRGKEGREMWSGRW